MADKEKVYCIKCKHLDNTGGSRPKPIDRCNFSVVDNWLAPDAPSNVQASEKNKNNDCTDFEDK